MGSTFYSPIQPNFSLNTKRLVVPVVSTANLGQLAADLLICTFNLERIGFLDDAYLVPAVGALDRSQDAKRELEGGISTSLELFGRPDLEIVVVQQRSPVLKAHKSQFVSSFTSWIRESQFKSVLFLAGLDLSNRADAQMLTPTYHVFASSSSSPSSSNSSQTEFDFSQIPSLKPVTPPLQTLSFDNNPTSRATTISLPGAGLASRFLNTEALAFSDPSSKLVCAAILQFVMEGDNRADAYLLARRVLKALKVDANGDLEINEPASWKGLFGEAFDQSSIFG